MISIRLGCAFLASLPALLLAQAGSERHRYRELKDELARHDDLYFRRGEPEISDAAYDVLKREYDALIERNPRLVEIGAAAPIGDDRTGLFPTRAHLSPMLSLRKASEVEGVRVFDRRLRELLGEEEISYVIEPKYDGVALSVVYEEGQLLCAVTRGNGVEGDDVTASARLLPGLPKKLEGEPSSWPARLELRGEVFVTYAQFERQNHERLAADETPFAHPRSLAAGTLRLTDVDQRARRELSFVVHGWGVWEPSNTQPASAGQFAGQLRTWGLPIVEHGVEVRGAEALGQSLQMLADRRRAWAFPTDGVVIKAADTSVRERVGRGADAPNWALAYKFAPEVVTTRVAGITLQVGRTGVLTPVAELAPVSISGVVVTRATLHSKAHLEKLDVRVGDLVELERAGEVIPRIVSVRATGRTPESQPFVWPRHCLDCRAELALAEGRSQVRCPNWGCRAQVLRRLEHFASPAALDLGGIGPALLEALIAEAGLRSPAGLYALDSESVRRAGGLPERFRQALEMSRRADLGRVLHGLGIPRLGAVGAARLAEVLRGLEDFLSLAERPDAEALSVLSPMARESVLAFLSHPATREDVRALIEVGVGRSYSADEGIPDDKLSGEVVVFTGALAGCTREEAMRWVQAAGGAVATSISRKTTLLVAGDSPGGKLEEARRLGVHVLSEAEFRERLGKTRVEFP